MRYCYTCGEVIVNCRCPKLKTDGKADMLIREIIPFLDSFEYENDEDVAFLKEWMIKAKKKVRYKKNKT